MKVRIGTRGSKLALWQAHFVADQLRLGGMAPEIVTIETKGDKILDRSLSKIGSKGVFTEELEEQLRAGTIDIAQHSAKDVQSSLPDDLELLAFTERELVNDVLVSFDTSRSLRSGDPFVVGTSSTRRVATLRHYYPHIRVVDMRGNLQTRLRKLEEGQADALLLAYAGVHRMGYEAHIAEHLSTDEFTPAVGQGSVAIECAKALDAEKKQRIRSLLNHAETETCLRAERAFLETLQGGCSIPSFALATRSIAGEVALVGGLVSLDGQQLLREQMVGTEPRAVGHELANQILALGGRAILDHIREQQRP
jgi:hydroxymethylbilane synthase